MPPPGQPQEWPVFHLSAQTLWPSDRSVNRLPPGGTGHFSGDIVYIVCTELVQYCNNDYLEYSRTASASRHCAVLYCSAM